ncbi:ribosomal protein S18-alanine N-acetyltransferase [Dactylosporangium sp. NPDC051541]|uniref:ribosomal protein S18-alanine N-acetyltransferase n=1 Tax=Dactylosporangium sp. NPDC051541 TaxID=3363977 RepID=UPI0037AB0742
MRWFHIEELLPIEDELFGEEQWSAGMFWNELALGHHYLVAVAGDAVLGYAGLALTAPDEAWVQNIGVRKDAQRRGIGRQLLEALLAAAGPRKVLLEVAVDNGPAQKLYAEYRFEAVGIRRGYYQPSNTDALVMMREN